MEGGAKPPEGAGARTPGDVILAEQEALRKIEGHNIYNQQARVAALAGHVAALLDASNHEHVAGALAAASAARSAGQWSDSPLAVAARTAASELAAIAAAASDFDSESPAMATAEAPSPVPTPLVVHAQAEVLTQPGLRPTEEELAVYQQSLPEILCQRVGCRLPGESVVACYCSHYDGHSPGSSDYNLQDYHILTNHGRYGGLQAKIYGNGAHVQGSEVKTLQELTGKPLYPPLTTEYIELARVAASQSHVRPSVHGEYPHNYRLKYSIWPQFIEVYHKFHPIDVHALRKELSEMKLSAIKRRALSLGVSAGELEAADDTDDIKEAVIELVVQNS
jgi:hypothetical protein